MKEIIPYDGLEAALASLDNGGRFYNILTHAGDDEIEPGELARVAGVYGDRQQMFLFLEMALCGCSQGDRDVVTARLSDDLRAQWGEHAPQVLAPSDADERGVAGGSAIITGFPRFVEDKTVFSGFIFVPISTGKTTAIMMIPIMDHFDVYELTDEVSSQTTFVANVRGTARLPVQRTRFGGILKETTRDKDGEEKDRLFLEGVYLTHLED